MNHSAFRWMAVFLAILLLAAPAALAKKGGGGKPGGDPPPPADPAIVYFSNGDLMVMNADGSNQTVVLADASSAYGLVDCSVSPDGTRVVFRGRIDGEGLYVIGLDGNGLTKILDNPPTRFSFHLKWSPAATPDGEEKIAFNMTALDMSTSDRRGNEVWVMNPDGSELQNLTDNDLRTEASPVWSADGTKLAVFFIELAEVVGGTVRTAAGLEILNLAADATGGIEIASTTTVLSETEDPDSLRMGALDWARDSNRLVFTQTPAGSDDRDLYIIDMDNPPTITRVTNTPDFDESECSWSPDDSRIVFRLRGYKKNAKLSGLHTISASGGTSTNLGAQAGQQPDWIR